MKAFAFAVLFGFSMDLVSGQAAPRAAAGGAPVPVPFPENFSILGVNVGGRPYDAVISPDERWAYILSDGSNEIDAVSLEPPRLSRRLMLDAYPTAMALSEDGSELYVGVASPPPPATVSDGSCPFVGLLVTSTDVLIVDTASMTVTDTVSLGSASLVRVLLRGSANTPLVAITDHVPFLIDTRTHAVVSIPVAAAGTSSMLQAVFSSNQTKVFVAHLTRNLTILDLTTRTSREAPAPPGDFEYFSTIAVDSAGEKVFVEVSSGRDFGVAVIDARTEEVLKVISGVAMWSGALFPPGGRVGYFLGRGDIVDLASLERIASLPIAGVAGALSPDASVLYIRPTGGVNGSITIWGYPAKYELWAIDTGSLLVRGFSVLDSRDLTCSWPSPVLVSKSGRYLVAPNPTLDSVSIIKPDTPRERAPVGVSHPRPAPILVPAR